MASTEQPTTIIADQESIMDLKEKDAKNNEDNEKDNTTGACNGYVEQEDVALEGNCGDAGKAMSPDPCPTLATNTSSIWESMLMGESDASFATSPPPPLSQDVANLADKVAAVSISEAKQESAATKNTTAGDNEDQQQTNNKNIDDSTKRMDGGGATSEPSTSAATTPVQIEPGQEGAPQSGSAPTSPSKAPKPEDGGPENQLYHVKWIQWGDTSTKTPVITQNENGPCPLLALSNVLLLRGQFSLPESTEIVSGQKLLTMLIDRVLNMDPKDIPEPMKSDYDKNKSDAMSNLDKLQTGIDMNIRFTG